MKAQAAGRPAKVIGEDALIVDRPGFEVEFLKRGSVSAERRVSDRNLILMVSEGHWRLSWDGGEVVLATGDTCALPPGLPHSLQAAVSGPAGMFTVANTDDPAGPTWRPEAA